MIKKFFDAIEKSRFLSFVSSFLALQLFVLAGTWIYALGADRGEIIHGLAVAEAAVLIGCWFVSASAQSRLKVGETLLKTSSRGLISAPFLGAGFRFGRVFLTTLRVGVSEFPFRTPLGADWYALEKIAFAELSDGEKHSVSVRDLEGREIFRFKVFGAADSAEWLTAKR